MNILNYLVFRFDLSFRKKKYAQVVLSGIKSEMLRSLSALNSYIAHENSEIDFEKELWRDRKRYVSEKYTELNSYGFKNRKEYFSSENILNNDNDLEILNIIQSINENSLTAEAVEQYQSSIETHNAEIEAAKKIIAQLEKMSPIICSAKIESLSEIEKLFKENECSLLLNMPKVINFERAISEYYFR